MFYLPNLLYLGTDAARSMTALTVAHSIIGGLGAWWLARRWELSRAAAWTAAVGFALSGPAVSSTAYPNICWPLAWLPWAMVAHEEAVHGRTRRGGVAGLAFVWVSMLSMGDPIVLGAALVGSGLLVLRDVVGRRADRSWRKHLAPSTLPVGAAAALSLVLASPLLVAIARYFPSSVRAAGFKAAAIVLWSLHPLLLVGLILPDPFGDPNLSGPAGFWASALAIDRPRPLLTGLYVGGLMLALFILGMLRRSPHRVTLVVWLGLLVVLALGRYGPIYAVAGDAKGFDALRYPMKWIVPAMLPLALLAGLGLDQLRESVSEAGVSRRGPAVFLSVLVLLALVSVASMSGLDRALVSLAAQPGVQIGDVPLQLFVRDAWVSAATRSAIPLGIALLALVFLPRARAGRLILPAIATLVTLDVALANRDLAPTVTSDFYAVPRAAAAILADPAGHERVFIDDAKIDSQQLHFAHPPETPLEAVLAQRDSLASYVGASAGLSLAFNGDTEAFGPLAYARAGVLVRSAPLREKVMLVGAAGATHIVTAEAPDGVLVDPVATLSGAFHPTIFVYRNPFAVSRVRIVPRLTPYASDAEFIQLIRSAPDDLFRRTALVEQQELRAAGLPSDTSAANGGDASVIAEDNRSLVLRTEGAGGFLIVSDTFVPGWTARVDGQPAPLFRVDLGFRAVPVPSGIHRVEMRYNPW
jgi:hypothetical protein